MWLLGICAVVHPPDRRRAVHGPATRTFVQALRDASFVVVTIVSTTGFGTADYELWPAWSKVLLAMLMLIGGCSGSTAGGFKVGALAGVPENRAA